MKFTSDRQRKAVMARLNRFSIDPDIGGVQETPQLTYSETTIGGGSEFSSKPKRVGAYVSDVDHDDVTYGREKFEVCGRCEGRGSHDPEGFSQGFTSSEMAEMGDDFEEDYFAGKYDVPCKECKGRRVTPIIVSQSGYTIHENKIPIREDPNGAVYFYDHEFYVTKDGEFVKEFGGDRAAAVRFIKQEEGMLPKPTGVGKKLKGSDYSIDPLKARHIRTDQVIGDVDPSLDAALMKSVDTIRPKHPVDVTSIKEYGATHPTGVDMMQEFIEKNKRGKSLGSYVTDDEI